jgi:hypothetical protein
LQIEAAAFDEIGVIKFIVPESVEILGDDYLRL